MINSQLSIFTTLALSALLLAVPAAAQQADPHAGHMQDAAKPAPVNEKLPPDATGAPDALKRSSRHQEWVDISVPGSTVPLKTFVVYPERKEKAGVVIVIQPALNAAVVYYGTSPANTAPYANIKAPVLGLYAGNDARVNATIPTAEEMMKKEAKSYEPHTFEGAGHGFLRQQSGAEGANMRATEKAWPLTIAFFRKHLS